MNCRFLKLIDNGDNLTKIGITVKMLKSTILLLNTTETIIDKSAVVTVSWG